jgi:DNA-binding PadR family transcriptional regulator
VKTPKISLRQYAILSMACPSAWVRIILTDAHAADHKWHTGEALRKKLRWSSTKLTFYREMTRLEEMGLVSGRYCRKDLSRGRVCKEREYAVTTKGEKAIHEVDDFYDYFSRIIHTG